ncbi:response regulator [Shewanella sp.]|uniref:response regulator n=1 Tax=Shewanella sp. TaxID=50422 RepID=UPI00356AF4E6
MNEKPRLLLVDDSPSELRILMETLHDRYSIKVATSGEQGLSMLGESLPDLVLLDVFMVPLNGYQVCEQLKVLYPQLPVIFVSAHTETDEILKGFAVGGQDYITKPFDPEVLERKVNLTLKQVNQQQKLDREKKEATAMVMAAMGSAADISVIVNFLRASTKLRDAQSLVQSICEASSQYGIQVCSRIVGVNDNPFYAASLGGVQPLEQMLMDRTAELNCRFLEKGNRLILHYESVVMLVKNLPDKPERVGELRDYLFILMEAANDLNLRVKSDSNATEQRMTMMMETVDESRITLHEIQEFQTGYKQKNMQIMNDLMMDIQTGFLSMGLSEEQEEWITATILRKLDESVTHLESGLKVDDKLLRIIRQLDNMAKAL